MRASWPPKNYWKKLVRWSKTHPLARRNCLFFVDLS
jgi:hypothetical protein